LFRHGLRFNMHNKQNYIRKTINIVLMYHDLRRDDSFESWLKVGQSNFRRQIKFLSKIAMFIVPEEILGSMNSNSKRLKMLLTFDDGQVNNYRLALPILNEHHIPALFFVSTDNVMSGELFWFDRIILPIQTKRLSKLNLEHYGLGNYFFQKKSEQKRWDDIQKVLADIKKKYGPVHGKNKEFENILRYFDQLNGKELKRLEEESRPLSIEEIRKMSAHKNCHLGSHSHRHEILTYLNDSELKENIEKSKILLENISGRKVEHISYPNGNFDERVIRFCQQGGFRYGYTTIPKVVNRFTHPMNIPRIAVGGFDTPLTILINILKAIIFCSLNKN